MLMALIKNTGAKVKKPEDMVDLIEVELDKYFSDSGPPPTGKKILV